MYTGKGTKSDPYIVDNWEDFVSVAYETAGYVKFADGGGKIDMNEHYPKGISKVNINSTEVDFNNWTIENLYTTNGGFSGNNLGTLKNLKLLNVYHTGGYLLDQFNLENCTVTGIIMSTPFYVHNYETKSLRYCSFNFITEGTVSRLVSGSDSDIYDAAFCHFNISNYADDIYPFGYMRLKNCLITGETSQRNAMIVSNSRYDFCVFDFDAPNCSKGNCSSTNVCIYNKDKAPNLTTNTNFIGFTTEEMKDPQKYRDAGFPMGVE